MRGQPAPSYDPSSPRGTRAEAPPRRPSLLWTPARLALLEAEYADVPCAKGLLARLNAMAGVPVSDHAMRCQASLLGVHRQSPRRRAGRPAAAPPAFSTDDLLVADADAATIADWAAANGVPGNPPRLAAVNARRLQHGLPPFVLTWSCP